MTSINTDVSDYTLSELMAIVEIDDLTHEEIIENTNYYMRKYKTKNPELSVFFKEIQSQLLQYAKSLEQDSEDDNDNSNAKIIVEGYSNMANDATYPSGDKIDK